MRDLREMLFGSPTGTVPPDQASRLLESPATQYLEPTFFNKHDIQFATHVSKIQKWKPMLANSKHFKNVRLWVSGDGRRFSATRRVIISDAQGGYRPSHLRLQGRQGIPGFMLVHPGTWLGLIASRCENIAVDFLWSLEQAIWFALTGAAPLIDPVGARYEVAYDNEGNSLRVEVVLRAQPFLSRDTLDHAMSALRLNLGRRLRLGPPMAARTLRVFDFVEEERARGGERWATVPWARLVKRWDRAEFTQRNDWGYRGDRRNFRRDYERARKLLINEFISLRDRQDAGP